MSLVRRGGTRATGDNAAAAAVEAPVCRHQLYTCIINDCCGLTTKPPPPSEEHGKVEHGKHLGYSFSIELQNRPKEKFVSLLIYFVQFNQSMKMGVNRSKTKRVSGDAEGAARRVRRPRRPVPVMWTWYSSLKMLVQTGSLTLICAVDIPGRFTSRSPMK